MDRLANRPRTINGRPPTGCGPGESFLRFLFAVYDAAQQGGGQFWGLAWSANDVCSRSPAKSVIAESR